MIFHMFMVFLTSAGFALIGVRSLQTLAHFGWFTPQARPTWNSLLTIPVLIILGYLSAVRLPPERWGLAIALGMAVGILSALSAKPQWPRTS